MLLRTIKSRFLCQTARPLSTRQKDKGDGRACIQKNYLNEKEGYFLEERVGKWNTGTVYVIEKNLYFLPNPDFEEQQRKREERYNDT